MIYFCIWVGFVAVVGGCLIALGSRIKPKNRPDGIYSKDNLPFVIEKKEWT